MNTRICANSDCKVEFILRYPADTKKYCSRSCSASATNKEKPKRVPGGRCKVCNEPIRSRYVYCADHRPTKEKIQDAKIKDWLEGRWSGGGDSTGNLSRIVRRFLLESANYSCSKCGFNTPHPVDGSSILEINHIDGNSSNHSPDNLEVLCPNHHALTPSYRGRNKGNGRKVYYLRVSVEKDASELKNR